MPSAEVLAGFLRAHGLQLNAQQQAAVGAVEGAVLLRALYFRGKGEYPTDAELKQARTLIAYAKNQMLGKEELDLLWKELDCFPALYRAYQQALRNARQMDYDDQMVYALRILRQVPEILHEFQARYHYFCVDEAQDTSRIQHAIVSLLAGAGGNLFLVGDEDQSIYGFRAACPDMLLHFEADHPGAKVLFLEQNYRSTPQIVEAADRFIRQNVSRRDKHMQPVRSGGAAIRQIPLNRRERQYTYLLEVARDLPENTAVLYRDHDSALPLIDLLERNGVPYRAKQTDGTFFSSRIVRDITDIIRFAQSPWDGALFRRIYYKFCAGIPKAVAERAAAHNPTAEPLLLAVADDDVSPYTRRQCRMLQTHLQNLRTEKANRAVYRIVAFMGYGDYLDQCGADKSRAEILEALGAQEPRICAITAAMLRGTGLDAFAAHYPERCFDVGIAEGHAVSMAGGLAKQGMIPVVAIYSTFLQRAYDMLLQDVAMLGLHVVFAVDRAGLVGGDGETHHGVFDVNYLRSVPGMQVLCPASQAELGQMLRRAVLEMTGPVAVRYPRGCDGAFTGIAEQPRLREGKDITLVTYGTLINEVLSAAKLLEARGISAEVLKLPSIKPLDVRTVAASMRKTGRLLVAEEAVCIGCAGKELLPSLRARGVGGPVRLCNLGDRFIPHGAVPELYRLAGLDARSLADAAWEVCQNEA